MKFSAVVGAFVPAVLAALDCEADLSCDVQIFIDDYNSLIEYLFKHFNL